MYSIIYIILIAKICSAFLTHRWGFTILLYTYIFTPVSIWFISEWLSIYRHTYVYRFHLVIVSFTFHNCRCAHACTCCACAVSRHSSYWYTCHICYTINTECVESKTSAWKTRRHRGKRDIGRIDVMSMFCQLFLCDILWYVICRVWNSNKMWILLYLIVP